jgi:hypothetical protein
VLELDDENKMNNLTVSFCWSKYSSSNYDFTNGLLARN